MVMVLIANIYIIPCKIDVSVIATCSLAIIAFITALYNIKSLRETADYRLHNDVAEGRLGGTQLTEAINKILEKGVNLSGMNLSNKLIKDVNLEGQDMYCTNFKNSGFSIESGSFKFNNANLQRACFKNAYLRDSSFFKANLILTNFDGAYLLNADFKEANLLMATFNGAYLKGANFKDAEQLAKAQTLYDTKGLDDDIKNSLMNTHGHLFEKPA